MGIGWRIFLFEEDGSLRRISHRASAMLRDGELAYPEYAGKTIRLADVFLDLEDRKPVRIHLINGTLWRLGEDGTVGKKWIQEGQELSILAIEMRLADAEGRRSKSFRQKRLRQLHDWKLTPADISKIVNAIWKPGAKPRRRV